MQTFISSVAISVLDLTIFWLDISKKCYNQPFHY